MRQSGIVRHGGDRRRAADLLRGGGQIGPIPPARLAARRHGRPDAGQRPDPCRHDGGGGRLYALPGFFHLRSRRRCTSSPWIGGITALMAALIAVQQDDIKRILAYSTLSQLGYMVMAVGFERAAGGDVSSDHARLFQGAAVPGRRLGHSRLAATSRTSGRWAGLKEKMPVTYWTFLVGHAGPVRLAAVQRFLQQGRHPGRGLGTQHDTCSPWECLWPF